MRQRTHVIQAGKVSPQGYNVAPAWVRRHNAEFQECHASFLRASVVGSDGLAKQGNAGHIVSRKGTRRDRDCNLMMSECLASLEPRQLGPGMIKRDVAAMQNASIASIGSGDARIELRQT